MVLLIPFFFPSDAHAFLCSRTEQNFSGDFDPGSGPSLAWPTRHVTFVLEQSGTDALDDELEFEILREAFAQWGQTEASAEAPDNLGCDAALEGATDLSFSELSSENIPLRIGYDYLAPEENQNLIVFRDQNWPHPGAENTIALTTTTFNAVSGALLDADIEFNSEHFDFSSGASGYDLLNAAVHEVGHLIGLAHSTVDGATMIRDADIGDISKRDLACDDLNGLIFKYPAGLENRYCEDTIDESCGFCQRPDQQLFELSVFAGETNDGLGGWGCYSVNIQLWFLYPFLWLAMHRRRDGTLS